MIKGGCAGFSSSSLLTMAKSLRSKTKRAFRAKKRSSGVYAAAEAARLNRLNAKLATTINQGNKCVGDGEDSEEMETPELKSSSRANLLL